MSGSVSRSSAGLIDFMLEPSAVDLADRRFAAEENKRGIAARQELEGMIESASQKGRFGFGPFHMQIAEMFASEWTL